MKRKFLSLVLALVMVLGTVSAVFAETTPLTTNDSKVQWLVDNEYVVGRTVNKDDTNPDLALDKTITRAEVSKLLVYTLGQEKLADVLKGALKVFPDVDLDHWANGYISVLATNRVKVASGRDVVIGYEDGYFRPSNDVTYAELATMLVRIVKADLTKKMEDEAIWATSYIRWAEQLGILEGITLVNSDAPAVRKDAFVMIYNAMHKLNLVGKNKVDWGIKIGVISKLQAGKMEINQDKEQTYNLTYNTVVTNGTTWNQVNVNSVVPGSLVRFIADENGNISHLMIVSFPTFGNEDVTAAEGQYLGIYSGYHYTDKNRIFDLGAYVAGGSKGLIKLTNTYRPEAGFIVTENNDDTTAKTIVPIRTTRYFVADPTNNALREVKSIDEALKVYVKPDAKNQFKGYVIYNVAEDYAGNEILEASYVVFTEVDKFDEDVLRVRYAPNGLYNVELEGPNPKMEIVHRNLFVRQYLPTTYNILNKFDVVSLKYAGNGPTQDADIRINSKSANVYVVTGIGNRFLYLKDKYGLEARVGFPEDTIVFGPLKKGAHVQIDREAVVEDVKIVSVVPFDLKGEMQFDAKDTGLKTALFVSVSNLNDPVQNGYAIVTVADKIRSDGNLIGERSYLVSVDKAKELFETMEKGTKVQFIVEEAWNYAEGKRYANSFVDVAAADKAKEDKAAAEAFAAKAKDLPSDDVTVDNFPDRYNKAKELSDEFKALSAEAKALVEDDTKTKVNDEIGKVNTFNTDHDLGKDAIDTI